MLVGLMFMVMTALILVAARPSITQTPGGAGKRLVTEGPAPVR